MLDFSLEHGGQIGSNLSMDKISDLIGSNLSMLKYSRMIGWYLSMDKLLLMTLMANLVGRQGHKSNFPWKKRFYRGKIKYHGYI